MKTYNALKDLEFINEQLFFYLYLVGLNPDKAESYSIDEIIHCTRSIIGNIRRIWYMKQLAAVAVNNAV